jgi:hypothetical protein
MEAKSASSEMRALIKEHGSELVGPVAKRMASLARTMLLKQKDVSNLGVMSKSDEDILNDIVANPTGLGGATTSTASLLAINDAFDASIDRALTNQGKALGYRRPGAQPEKEPAPLSPGPTDGWTDADEKRLQELEAKAAKGDLPILHSGGGR